MSDHLTKYLKDSSKFPGHIITRNTWVSDEMGLDPIFDKIEEEIKLHFKGTVKNIRINYLPHVLVYSIYLTHFLDVISDPKNFGFMVLSVSQIKEEAERILQTIYYKGENANSL